MRCKVNCAAFVSINMPQVKESEAMQWQYIAMQVPIYSMLDLLTRLECAA
jgi:hypothetical protein